MDSHVYVTVVMNSVTSTYTCTVITVDSTADVTMSRYQYITIMYTSVQLYMHTDYADMMLMLRWLQVGSASSLLHSDSLLLPRAAIMIMLRNKSGHINMKSRHLLLHTLEFPH